MGGLRATDLVIARCVFGDADVLALIRPAVAGQAGDVLPRTGAGAVHNLRPAPFARDGEASRCPATGAAQFRRTAGNARSCGPPPRYERMSSSRRGLSEAAMRTACHAPGLELLGAGESPHPEASRAPALTKTTVFTLATAPPSAAADQTGGKQVELVIL